MNQKSSFMGSAFKLGTELVAAVAVGTIIGFILDTWFDTKPWLIIIFFFLGSAAGMLNVIKDCKSECKKKIELKDYLWQDKSNAQFSVHRIGPEIKIAGIDLVFYKCKFIHGYKRNLANLLSSIF